MDEKAYKPKICVSNCSQILLLSSLQSKTRVWQTFHICKYTSKRRKRLFANRITTLLLLKTSFDYNSQITFFCICRMFWPPGERICWPTTRKKKSTPQTRWKNVPGKQPNFFPRTKIEWTVSKQNWRITQLYKARCFLHKSVTSQTCCTLVCSAWSCNYFYIILTYAICKDIEHLFCFVFCFLYNHQPVIYDLRLI